MSHTSTTRDIDELAAMFLTAPEAVRPPAPARRLSLLEVLLVGHLPVRGSVWVAPYAHAVAEERGSAALVRLDGDEPALQIFGPSPTSTTGLTFREAIVRLVRADMGAWILRPKANEPIDELTALSADRLTVLTSADSVAVVAVYQVVKALASTLERSGADLPPVALAVMGCDAEAAVRMVERLNRTAAEFLEAEVTLAMCLPRIDIVSGPGREMRFHGEQTPATEEICRWIAEARNEAPLHLREPQPPLRLAGSQPRGSDSLSDGLGGDEPFAPVVKTIKLSPKPRMRIERPTLSEPLGETHGEEPSLTAHVPGLSALPVRCPRAPKIELAVDGLGGLHLLAWHDALRELHAARAWSADHCELLSMACAEQRLDAKGSVTCHLFTDEPAAVADLHGTELRLHVLARLEPGMTCYAAPLTR
jgi:hypothetical protein